MEINADDPAQYLTKREYFAVRAMQGLISNQHWIIPDEVHEIAESSILIADALIAELNKDEAQT